MNEFAIFGHDKGEFPSESFTRHLLQVVGVSVKEIYGLSGGPEVNQK